MKIISRAFENESLIPSKYTCDGENINPPLEFLDVPEKTQSLVLLMEDPDVPKHIRADGMWDHWIVFNIPPNIKYISENSTPPGIVGLSTSKNSKYGGPCPPDREHRYFFKLFALDTMLELKNSSSKQDVLDALKGHVIQEAELIGKYKRI